MTYRPKGHRVFTTHKIINESLLKNSRLQRCDIKLTEHIFCSSNIVPYIEIENNKVIVQSNNKEKENGINDDDDDDDKFYDDYIKHYKKLIKNINIDDVNQESYEPNIKVSRPVKSEKEAIRNIIQDLIVKYRIYMRRSDGVWNIAGPPSKIIKECDKYDLPPIIINENYKDNNDYKYIREDSTQRLMKYSTDRLKKYTKKLKQVYGYDINNNKLIKDELQRILIHNKWIGDEIIYDNNDETMISDIDSDGGNDEYYTNDDDTDDRGGNKRKGKKNNDDEKIYTDKLYVMGDAHRYLTPSSIRHHTNHSDSILKAITICNENTQLYENDAKSKNHAKVIERDNYSDMVTIYTSLDMGDLTSYHEALMNENRANKNNNGNDKEELKTKTIIEYKKLAEKISKRIPAIQYHMCFKSINKFQSGSRVWYNVPDIGTLSQDTRDTIPRGIKSTINNLMNNRIIYSMEPQFTCLCF